MLALTMLNASAGHAASAVIPSEFRGTWIIPNDGSGDIKFRHDFRQVYASVLRDHLGGSPADARAVLNGREFEKLPIFRQSSEVPGITQSLELAQNYPNPASDFTYLPYAVAETQPIRLTLHDLQGRELMTLKAETAEPGTYTAVLHVATLPAGQYLYSLQGHGPRQTKRLLVARG